MPTATINTLNSCLSSLVVLLPASLEQEAVAFFKIWRSEVMERARQKKESILARENAFRDAVEQLKIDLHALSTLDNRTVLFARYIELCLPTPDSFIANVLCADPGTARAVQRWGDMLPEERVPWIGDVESRVEEGVRRPPHPSNVHHSLPRHAAPAPSASHSAPVPHMDHPSRELQRFLYADDPLLAACQVLFDACTGAGMSREAQREWYGRARVAIRGNLPPPVQEQLVHIVEETTSLIQLEPAPDKVIKALKDCLVDLRKTMDRHAFSAHGRETSEFRSLGSSFPSSPPYHRLSHRHRVIYGRTFSSSAY